MLCFFSWNSSSSFSWNSSSSFSWNFSWNWKKRKREEKEEKGEKEEKEEKGEKNIVLLRQSQMAFQGVPRNRL